MAEYTSGSITFQGLGSGTDFSQVIEGLMTIERMQVNKLESWKTEWEDKIEALQELNTSLLSLETTLETMDRMDEFVVKNVDSSDSDTVSATADSDALITNHTVEVNQLAENDIWVHSGLPSTDTVLNEGTFSFEYGTEGGSNASISIPVSAGTTLQGLVNMINNNSTASAYVRASLINDGESYHLQIAGKDLGADHTITLTDYSSVLGGSFDQTSTAQDAEFKVDGYPPGAAEWMTRGTNSISDAVDGLTINLKQVTGGTPVNLDVTTDTDAIKDNVRTFVDQVNEVRAKIQELTEVQTDGEDEVEASVLTGNYTVQNLISQELKDCIASSGLGFILPDPSRPNAYHDEYTSLAQVGIMTNANEGSATAGLLELDEESLDEALAENPDSVAELFAAYYDGTTDNSNFSYASHIDGITKAGEHEVSYNVTPFGIIQNATIDGEPAKIDQVTGNLTAASTTDAAGLVVTVTNRTLGTYSGSAYLRLGKINELIDDLKQITNTTDGPIKVLTDNYNDIINNIDDKIDREEDRLTLKERNLKLRYSRLDTLLQEYSSRQTQLQNGLAQLG